MRVLQYSVESERHSLALANVSPRPDVVYNDREQRCANLFYTIDLLHKIRLTNAGCYG